MITQGLLGEFEKHATRLRNAKRARAEELTCKSFLEEYAQPTRAAQTHAEEEETIGVPLSTDKYEGDTHLRTLNTLLAKIDNNGFERSSQQLDFHSAFTVACGRVLYRKDWSLNKPAICSHLGWTKSFSEVMISTPRRFGKTFSVAMFVCCMSLSIGIETVIFSPARRASRKILERVVEFLRLVGASDRIVEFNQEACRIRSYDGKKSLIRSFPVCPLARPPASSVCPARSLCRLLGRRARSGYVFALFEPKPRTVKK